MNATKLKKIICVWLDETSDTEFTAWVVSRDGLDSDTLTTETTATVRAWRLDEYADAEALAVAYAIDLGRRTGTPVYRCDQAGHHTPLES